MEFNYKVRSRSKKKPKNPTAWLGIGLIFGGIFLFTCVLFPSFSGLWGRKTAQFLGWLVGLGQFILPVLIVNLGVRILWIPKRKEGFLPAILINFLFLVTLIFLNLLGMRIWNENYGGIIGLLGKTLFVRLFGELGCWIVVLGGGLSLAVLLARLSPADLVHRFLDLLKTDWENWTLARSTVPKTPQPPVVSGSPALSPQPRKHAPLKISGLSPEEVSPLPVNKESLHKGETFPSKKIEKTFLQIQEKQADKKPEPPPIRKPYIQPSLDIFEPLKRIQPVVREELTTRARLLEQTLANFNIAATVVEIHPGPVITRYDLEPAPGVKVASISSRADDITLALKSTGIRVLAPIPGKGAVGIEIPNSSPERVGLAELLTTPQFVGHDSPLAFVLGKTVSGEPCVVDLASLPHLLIAGSTGSGKSVCVHALLCSILYRMPPDLVKLVMIDPKRLELPGYSGIPHLYDPRCGPLQATVITNTKEAAKALLRLVKVMDYRYDQLAKANVRNIDSYNKKRKEAGLAPEFYLVVVIDELADLMLTSPQEVEDSIQRLAQMARAVGIHLVLATQRPSVDVLTGVIKANLPSRIALRVASVTDSRVIIDTAGADVLLGKGDMLYLPPASSEPIRVQGAYVSEKEVENLVNHVKQFGLPSYDDLFGSGSALAFAVEDKKEMKDLIEALKLVLERHRVSQDLLKAHFGSSARATNILSLLEVKEFIKKPEGSNRWEIDFDLIEDFLSKVANIPEEEIMA